MENDFLVSYLNSSGFYSGIIYWLLIVIILLLQKKNYNKFVSPRVLQLYTKGGFFINKQSILMYFISLFNEIEHLIINL